LSFASRPRQASIAVVMATHNQARLLERALQGIGRQTRPPVQTVVVDDGSTDETAAVLAAARLPGLAVLRQANQGVSVARNAGLAAASAEFVLFLDDDDSLEPSALERLGNLQAAEPLADLVHADWDFVSDTSSRCLPQSSELGPEPLRTLIRRNPLALHCVLARRQALLDLGGFRPRGGALEDWELWLRLAVAGACFRHLPEVLAHYHWRPGSGSSRAEAMHEVRLAVLAEQRVLLGNRLSPTDWEEALATAWMDHAVNQWRADNLETAAVALRQAERHEPGLLARWDSYYRLWFADYLEALSDRGPADEAQRWRLRERRMTALLGRLSASHAVRSAAAWAQAQALREAGQPWPSLIEAGRAARYRPVTLAQVRALRLVARSLLDALSWQRSRS